MKKQPTQKPKKAEQTIKVEDLEPKQDVKGGGQGDSFTDIIVSADGGSAARKQSFHGSLITELTVPKND